MNRLRRSASIAGSLLIIAGLAAAVAVRTAASAPVAAAATAAVQGADVSSLNGTPINWTNVTQSERFVAVKASEGNYLADSAYQANVAQAVAAGLYVMPYVFANPYPGNGTGKAQADYAWTESISKVTAPAYKSGALMLPVAVDLENDPYAANENSNACYGLSVSAMKTWIGAFITEMRKLTGKIPVIYTTTGWWDNCTADTNTFNADPLWLASYDVAIPSIPSAWSSLAFWQYSDAGTVSGIPGPVDLDSLGPTQAGQLNTAIPAEQVQTLTSLHSGTASAGYTATGLPPGVSISSAGQITGKPTAVGQYTVTVTPPTGAIPASMPFTWDVHASIALATANRSSTAGAPISLTVPASGPDKNIGFAPALKATGLPTGPSMTSAGVITGWASRPGIYKVTVTAADALGGTGSASFTWTVSAAADSGTAGPIRQVGGSGKCLNDPAGSTANGTLLTLWTCNGKANQRWITVQDGTLRTGGKCLGTVGNSTASGAKLQLDACNAANGAQHWLASTDGQLVNPQSGKCLDVLVASATNGTHPVIEPCTNSTSKPNEHWIRPAAPIMSGKSGKCVANPTGASAVLAACANVAAQHWQLRTDGTVRTARGCLTETVPTPGSRLAVSRCAPATASLIKWKLLSAGSIATELVNIASGLCVSAPSTGTNLTVAACANAAATTWRVG